MSPAEGTEREILASGKEKKESLIPNVSPQHDSRRLGSEGTKDSSSFCCRGRRGKQPEITKCLAATDGAQQEVLSDMKLLEF